jgi:hypothetical protein
MDDATVLRVNTSIDENDGSATEGEGLSLRDAVLIANSTPEAEIIELESAQTYTLSIAGTDPAPFFDDTNPTTIGDLDLAANGGKLTIRGLGEGATIDANQINRVLQLQNDSSNNTAAELVLENITITNGKAIVEGFVSDDGGGAILINNGATAELIDCILTSNSAPEQDGGAIQNKGTLTVRNSIIDGNTAQNGGAIHTNADSLNNVGVTKIVDSTLTNNTANISGGAIKHLINGTTEITGSTIANNTAGSGGGGVVGDGTELSVSITESTIRGNTAGSSGGGVNIQLINSFTIENAVIEENIASNDGGGIEIDSGLDAEVTILNTTVQNNEATGNGGGVNAQGVVDVTLRGSVIRGNTAGNDGGGVNSFLANFFVDSSIIDGNNAGGTGGGLNDVDLIRNSTISNNQAAGSGGGFFTDTRSIVVNSTINGNQSDRSGGGISVRGAGSGSPLVDLSNTTISGNSAKTYGGGISIIGSIITDGDLLNLEGNVIGKNLTITGNIADSDNDGEGNGGGIHNFPTNTVANTSTRSGRLSLTNSILAGNFDTPENSGEGDIQPDISGAAKGNANNLVGNLEGLTIEENVATETESLGQENDIISTNLQLGALRDNGGSTQTHALLTGSPAINAGNNSNISRETFVDDDGDSITIDFNDDGDTEDAIPFDQREGEFSRIFDGTVDIGAYEVQENEPEPEPDTETLTQTINRFQNRDIPGTYLFAGENESTNIREDFPNFEEEGIAFNVSFEPGDDLIPLYRFQSNANPGTYTFVGESERQGINENFSEDFTEEGLAFYVYGVGEEKGTTFYRFQNEDRPGTYLFAGPDERANILENFPNFTEEGPAFEVGV